MGGWDLLMFKSKGQRQRDEAEFFARVFPLGPGQKDAAAGLLEQLPAGAKGRMDEKERLFLFICAKEAYLAAATEDERLGAAEAYLKKHSKMDTTARSAMLALLVLDSRAQSLEGYPTLQQVAGQIPLVEAAL